MITDHLNNAALYRCLHSGIGRAFDYLQSDNLNLLAELKQK